MQNFEVTNEEHYGMLWYFLEWSIGLRVVLFKGNRVRNFKSGFQKTRQITPSLLYSTQSYYH